MRLIGMLDSPYVRRVAVALHLMEVPFDHEPVSVIRQFDAFAALNPVVKAPTLVTDGGTVLMESSLILLFAERFAARNSRLAPEGEAEAARALRLSGLALAACEKTVAIAYELNFRPEEKRHRPWLDRVEGQMRQAYRLLEAEIPEGAGWLVTDRPMQADVDAAVAWAFTHSVLSGVAPDAIPAAADHPRLAALSARAEALPAFRAAPTA
jgi:glutathione S-transferase